jgi:Tfp pilus assembly protein PilF
MQGNRQQALNDFKNALERRPDIPALQEAVSRLGGQGHLLSPVPRRAAPQENNLYHRAHDAEIQAHAAFEQVAKLAPDSYRAHQILAESLTAQERLDEANAEYRMALNSKPDVPGIHDAIGMNLLRTGKLEEALKEFEAEIAVQRRSATAHMHAGQVLLLMGSDDEARKMLTSAEKMDRPPADVFRLLGKLDLRAKHYQSAVNELTRYVSVNKDDARAYYLLSKAYTGVGNRDQASRALASFEKTSRDVKARSRAQAELATSDNENERIDEEADLAQIPE